MFVERKHSLRFKPRLNRGDSTAQHKECAHNMTIVKGTIIFLTGLTLVYVLAMIPSPSVLAKTFLGCYQVGSPHVHEHGGVL